MENMIELNLLPKELRRKKKKKVSVETVRPPVMVLAIGVFVVLVIVHVTIMMLVGGNRAQIKSLQKKWDESKFQREKAAEISREIESLKKKTETARRIVKPDMDWDQLLTGLNQAVIPNIWLSDLSLDFYSNKSKARIKAGQPIFLRMTGYALGNSGQATSLIAKFINSLQGNKKFSEYFSSVELEDIRSQQIDGEEVMLFRLECRLKNIEPVVIEEKKKKTKKRRTR